MHAGSYEKVYLTGQGWMPVVRGMDTEHIYYGSMIC